MTTFKAYPTMWWVSVLRCWVKLKRLSPHKHTVKSVTSCPAGFVFKRPFEEGFNNNWQWCGSSLPQESGSSVWQLQERSADRSGQFLIQITTPWQKSGRTSSVHLQTKFTHHLSAFCCKIKETKLLYTLYFVCVRKVDALLSYHLLVIFFLLLNVLDLRWLLCALQQDEKLCLYSLSNAQEDVYHLWQQI